MEPQCHGRRAESDRRRSANLLDTGEVQFGGYNGYPQIFHEEVFHFSDIATYTHGKHTLKFGGEISRNYENSEFNVGRASYEFIDSWRSRQAPSKTWRWGLLPGTIDPATGDSMGGAHLASNIRAWRNISTGLCSSMTTSRSPPAYDDLGTSLRPLHPAHREIPPGDRICLAPSGTT